MTTHQHAMFLHAMGQIMDRYAVQITFEDYNRWCDAAKYDYDNRLGDAKNGCWYQRLKHDGVSYFAIASSKGIHTILTKKIVRKTLGLKKLND